MRLKNSLVLGFATGLAAITMTGAMPAQAATTSTSHQTITRTFPQSPVACQAQGEAPGCVILGKAVGTITTVKTPAGAAYYYGGWQFYACSGVPRIGCSIWQDTMVDYFTYNYSSIRNRYGTGPDCTASGYGTVGRYCGYQFDNTRQINYIDNFDVCVAFHGVGCFGHGIRSYINANGQIGSWFVF